MAFQLSGFQRNAFQMLTAAKNAAAKLNKKLRQNTRVRARADELREKYERLLKSEVAQETIPEVVQEVIRPYQEEAKEELPKAQEIDFEAMARNALAIRAFNNAIKLAIRQHEEEVALILILAGI